MSNAGPAVVTIVHGRDPDPPCACSRPDVQTYADRDCAIAAERLQKIAIALTPIAKARADRYRSRTVANRDMLSELLFSFLCSFFIISALAGKTWPPASARESPLLTRKHATKIHEHPASGEKYSFLDPLFLNSDVKKIGK